VLKFKKYLPIIIFVLGLLVLVGVYFLVVRGRGGSVEDEEANVPEVPLEQRPFTSLTPSEDGHWLKLEIKDNKVEAASLDYELLYQVADGRTQGVPGTVKIQGNALIVRDLLLGSESSGKFRYDEGVTQGTLTLRFRNDKGKLVGKLSTSFHLQTETQELTALEDSFKYRLDKLPKKTFFVVMNTFGLPGGGAVAQAGPYGIFASKTGPFAGKVEGVNQRWDGSAWQALTNGKSSDIGVFIQTSE
jgi:hypothetical protein